MRRTKLLTFVLSATMIMSMMGMPVMAETPSTSTYTVKVTSSEGIIKDNSYANDLQSAINDAEAGSTLDIETDDPNADVIKLTTDSTKEIDVDKNITITSKKLLSGKIVADTNLQDHINYTLNGEATYTLNAEKGPFEIKKTTEDHTYVWAGATSDEHDADGNPYVKVTVACEDGDDILTDGSGNNQKTDTVKVKTVLKEKTHSSSTEGSAIYTYTVTYNGQQLKNPKDGSYTFEYTVELKADEIKALHQYELETLTFNDKNGKQARESATVTMNCSGCGDEIEDVVCDITKSTVNSDGTTTYTFVAEDTTKYPEVKGTYTCFDLANAVVKTGSNAYDSEDEAWDDTTITIGGYDITEIKDKKFIQHSYNDTNGCWEVELTSGKFIQNDGTVVVNIKSTVNSNTFTINRDAYGDELDEKVVQYDGTRVKEALNQKIYTATETETYNGKAHSVTVIPKYSDVTVSYSVYKECDKDTDGAKAYSALYKEITGSYPNGYNLGSSGNYSETYYAKTDLDASAITDVGKYIVVANLKKVGVKTSKYAYAFEITAAEFKEPSIENGLSKVYGNTDPSGLVSGSLTDDLGNTLFEVSHSENVGTVNVKLVATKAAENYGYTEGKVVSEGSLTITKRDATISVPSSTITVGDTFNLSDVKATVVGETDADKGTIGVTVTCKDDYSKAGTYTLDADVVNANNYNVTIKTGTLTVKEAATEAPATTETQKATTATKKSTSFTIPYKSKTIKKSTLKSKKTLFSINAKANSGAKLTYKKLSGCNYISVTSAGKVVINPKLKGYSHKLVKGTHKIRVKISAPAKGNYAAGYVTTYLSVVIK